MTRLWIQVGRLAGVETVKGLESPVATFVAGLVSSGAGALLKTAADRLVEAREYTLSGVLAYEPAFRSLAGGSAEFLPGVITLNVGAGPVEFVAAGLSALLE